MLFTTLFTALLLAARPAIAVEIDMEGLPETGLDTSTWTTGTLPTLTDMWSPNDFQIAAKNVLTKKKYVGFRTAAVDEITYQANLNMWQYVRLLSYTFRDVSHVSLKTSILGYNFNFPFFIAPAANAGNAHPDGELNLARAAGTRGALYAPSISATKSIEEIAAAGAAGQIMFHQHYVWANQSQNIDELNRIKAAGFKAIFLTIDNTGIGGVRIRSLRTTGAGGDTGHAANFDLTSLAAYRNLTTLPIVPKGIRTWQDAKKCLELGFPAIYISNHGGRTLDSAPTALEIILDIWKHAPEVMTGLEVYADGGVRHGTDILKLLALGVRAVGMGRPPMFANVFGQPGVERLLDLVRDELTTEMALMGVNVPTDLNKDYINTKYIENNWLN
ncbi:FMN-dependent alpha-hydroxy acid dehydrogenase [Flagelloscypha sp. PMI_526]|nr:FMN-dependent alpha-hydroxy acid dehydrogenase [Flagelloscypha sp. PMI_526]